MGNRPTEQTEAKTHRRHARTGIVAVAGVAAGAAAVAGVVAMAGSTDVAPASVAQTQASPAQAQEEWEHIHGSVEQDGSYGAVAATAADEVWAFGSAPEDSDAPRIERWDGQRWQEETAPDGLTTPRRRRRRQ